MGDNSEQPKALAAIIAPFVGKTGGLLSALRAVQHEWGCLPFDVEAEAASAFNLSRAEVKGVISFYADFRRSEPGRIIIRICAAEACQAQGSRIIESDLTKRLNILPGQTRLSGDLTFERTYCLGLCSVGPAAEIDEILVGHASPERLVALVDERIRLRK